MSRDSLERLMARWRDDQDFRAAMRRDPESALQQGGFQLDEAELATVLDTDWSLPDEELQTIRLADVSASPPL